MAPLVFISVLVLLPYTLQLVGVASASECPDALLTDQCVCTGMDESLNVTCRGKDIVTISRRLPQNTVVFHYVALEIDVDLGGVDFSHVPRLQVLIVTDPRDFNILLRRITPMPPNVTLFHHLHELKTLRININWDMSTQDPDLFKGLTNLEVLDLSNTRLLNIDHLIVSLQGFRQSRSMRVLNLWNIKTLEYASKDLRFNLGKVLEPLSGSELEEVNIGYNAFRSVESPGLLLYAQKLKRFIARNNMLVPLITSALMTEILLHKTLEEADVREQGYRPAIDLPNDLPTGYSRKNPEEKLSSSIGKSYGKDNADHDRDVTSTIAKSSDVSHEVQIHHEPTRPSALLGYLPCVRLLLRDTCNIFSVECIVFRLMLEWNHGLFCALLHSVFSWQFDGIPCDAIPPFSKLISPNCGGCLNIPSSGNLKKMHVSHLNMYDYILLFGDYRDRTTCFFPSSNLEYIDAAGFAPRGHPEMHKIFQCQVTGLENLKFWNLSYNQIEIYQQLISSNNPILEILDISHNLLTLSEDPTFLDTAVSLQIINMSHNAITQIRKNAFSNLQNMRHIDISNNGIEDFDIDLSACGKLEYLDLSHNNLLSLSDFARDQLNQVALNNGCRMLHVNLQFNSLMCTCSTGNFIDWLLGNRPPNIIFIDIEKYICTNRYSDRVALRKVTTFYLTMECYENVIYGCLGAFALLSIYMLYTKRSWISIRYRRLRRLIRKRLFKTSSLDQNYSYDATLFYHPDDSDWIDMADRRLGHRHVLKYSDKDIKHGMNVAIAESDLAEQSRYSVLVFSDQFVKPDYKMLLKRKFIDKLEHKSVIIIALKPFKDIPFPEDRTLKEIYYNCEKDTQIWEMDKHDEDIKWDELSECIGTDCLDRLKRD